MVTGRPDDALARSERAMALDPYNVRTQSFHAIVLMHARRFDEAIAVAQRALSAEPGALVALTALTTSLFKQGRYDELRAVEKEAWAKDPEMLQILEAGSGGAGYAGTMAKFSDALAARYGKPGGRKSIGLAGFYARAGDKERVIQWLEKAFDEHDNNMPYIGSNPIYDLVRDDPRFQALARRVGVPVPGGS
jgi:tetratricopeptide (TPR) repeat protein